MSIADRMRCCASLVCRRPWPPPKAGRRWPPPRAAWAPRLLPRAPRPLPRAPPARLARRRARPALARCQHLPRERERERGREGEIERGIFLDPSFLIWEPMEEMGKEGKTINSLLYNIYIIMYLHSLTKSLLLSLQSLPPTQTQFLTLYSLSTSLSTHSSII